VILVSCKRIEIVRQCEGAHKPDSWVNIILRNLSFLACEVRVGLSLMALDVMEGKGGSPALKPETRDISV
jgi:hypothetical protein